MPRIDTLIKIASALGVRIDCALLDGITWEPGTTTMRAGSFAIASPASSEEREPMEADRGSQPKRSETTDIAAEIRESPHEQEEE